MRISKSAGPVAKLAAIGVVACLVGAACVSGAGGPPSSPSPIARPTPYVSPVPACLVGETWQAYAEERIEKWEQPALEKPIDAAGGKYELVDAKTSHEEQVKQIDAFVANGEKVIVVQATDPVAIVPAIERAADAGVAVVVFEYLVDSPKALIVAFDPVEIGRMEARAILAARPKGNYAIIKGHPQGQYEPDLIASGIHEILQPAIDKGDIKIVAETYTVNWDPSTAVTEMEQILVANHNKIDAVIAENDGLASGVIQALHEVGLDGKVAVAGAGGDSWSLNKVALGTQTVDVWPDLRLMGTAAGNAAVALCKNRDIASLAGTKPLTLPNHDQVTSILLTPQVVTRENLNVVIDSGWMKKDDVCKDVDASGAPAVCR